MHLCLHQLIPWAIRDGLSKGCLKYPLSAVHKRHTLGGKGAHAIRSSGMVCQGPAGDAIHSGGPSEDGFHEMVTPLSLPPLPLSHSLATQHSSQSSLTACICCRDSGQRKKPGAALQRPKMSSKWRGRGCNLVVSMGDLLCSKSGCSCTPAFLQDIRWHDLKALFKGTSVILIILSARTTGQLSAALGSFSGQNFSLLLMLSFS